MSQAYLLDTNILSELCKPQPDPKLIQFVAQQAQAWLSIITVHELEYGLNLLPEGNRRSQLAETIQLLLNQYTAFVLPIQQAEASQAARLRAQAKQQGRIIHLADALIAGTALVHGLTIATRNIKDFEGLGLNLVNPFSS
ncbi:type II toxin-antitoxin system VapC family toxin [uncultured Thiothrix sp.]|uniref:type II toxin-antitoxin system VapC family toxin n=1 Tax=uncultured Thiothrix sp. TaxID=223185 RepID=UPI0026121E2D|nr:type II toxin-antitoxin system VapC family toxin [uncultured Thiothrix sp.]HMT91749.1 type II toxin-antitoxin system VapC family toxin [Thiolinea sp.]